LIRGVRVLRAAGASVPIALSLAACTSVGHKSATVESAHRTIGSQAHRVSPAHSRARIRARQERSAAATEPTLGRVPRALVVRVPTRLPTRKRLVALTFDAGANDAGLPKIAATLARLRVPATFFMTGHFARFYPRWARLIAARYPIGNHTMNHVDLNGLSNSQVRNEVVEAQQSIRRVTGRAPLPLFRFPYGDVRARTLRIVNSLGYAAVGWTVDTAGWLGTSGGQSVSSVVARALGGLRPGTIILMHVGSNPGDGSTLDANSLATIIGRIERRGYAFATLPQVYAAVYPRWRDDVRRSRPSPLSARTGSTQLGNGVAPPAILDRFVRLGLPLYCGAPRGRHVALTFDDGPGPATRAALGLLRRFGDHATFFLVGRNLAQWPGIPRAELTVGAVGDHTWTHPLLTRLAPAGVKAEIARTQAALERVTGTAVRLFRPPYGFHDAAVDRQVRRLEMLEVLWSLDSRDSYPPPGASAGEIVRTLARSVRPGSIVLLHENLRQTFKALPAVLRVLQARGLRSVTVPELLAIDPPSLAQLRAGSNGCSS
jgi:peptidoglycan/xylan/chitin deacetylase (PgdA/CDA1 family)